MFYGRIRRRLQFNIQRPGIRPPAMWYTWLAGVFGVDRGVFSKDLLKITQLPAELIEMELELA